MKTAAVLFFALLLSAGAQISAIHTVYLLPMGNGMDQYLANRLTADGVFQVVTDPKRAGAVFADRLGEPFEQRMADLFPPEAPPAPKPEPKKDAAKKDDEEAPTPSVTTEESGPPRVSSFSRTRGNIFLVDVKTRVVLWSAYERPKSMTPDELNRTATRIVDRLKKALPKQQ